MKTDIFFFRVFNTKTENVHWTWVNNNLHVTTFLKKRYHIILNLKKSLNFNTYHSRIVFESRKSVIFFILPFKTLSSSVVYSMYIYKYCYLTPKKKSIIQFLFEFVPIRYIWSIFIAWNNLTVSLRHIRLNHVLYNITEVDTHESCITIMFFRQDKI